MDIFEVSNKYIDEFTDISKWCESTYADRFAKYFEEMRNLYSILESKTKPISDDDLELILTTIPLQLFAAAEELNKFKASIEVIKLHVKQQKHEVLNNSEASSQVAKREEASYSVVEDEMLIKVYSTVVDRVESEISFSKELIMSAKKIWTARKEAENITKPSEVPDLPDYSNMDGKSYIK